MSEDVASCVRREKRNCTGNGWRCPDSSCATFRNPLGTLEMPSLVQQVWRGEGGTLHSKSQGMRSCWSVGHTESRGSDDSLSLRGTLPPVADLLPALALVWLLPAPRSLGAGGANWVTGERGTGGRCRVTFQGYKATAAGKHLLRVQLVIRDGGRHRPLSHRSCASPQRRGLRIPGLFDGGWPMPERQREL